MILAIDPSIRSAGAALFAPDRRLVAAARITRTVPASLARDPVTVWRDMAQRIAAWAIRPGDGGVRDILQIVTERPQIYQRTAGKSKADPNDQLGMVGVIGGVAALFPRAAVASYTPAEWKGQTPKAAILARINAALTVAERALLPDSHDAGEAVGIGLRFLGRLEPRRVYPGAT